MAESPVLAGIDLRVARPGGWSLAVPALAVRRGEILAVIGPNGSGKSTLLRVLALLEAPDRGEVRFADAPVAPADALAVRRRLALVFQDPLLADATVAENVALGLRFRGRPRAEIATAVARWLGRFDLTPLAARRARTLSGGEARRVALARALVLEPEVLLLDEPFAALDAPSRAALLPELARVLRGDRVTTVFVTHDRGEAQALADRVAVLMDGRLRQLDDTAHVFQAPADEEVARFVGVETIVDGRVVRSEPGLAVVEVAGRAVEVAGPARVGARVRLGIRPEDITLVAAPGPPGLSSARNALAGTIIAVVPSPLGVSVQIDCGFLLVARVTVRSAVDMGLAAGAPVIAVFKASAAHVLAEAGPP